jgi:hypothetical protein
MSITPRAPIVTDHAVIRWMERAKGIPVHEIRKAIADIVAPAVALGATRFTKDGLTYILSGSNVVTITDSQSPSSNTINAVKAGGITPKRPNTRAEAHQLQRRTR